MTLVDAATELRVPIASTSASVSALLLRPSRATALLALAHGAGADMRHPFMVALATMLAQHGVATLRYQFPYTERGNRRPDAQPLLLETVRSAAATALEAAEGLPIFAGGKSMGGRMTTLAASQAPLSGVRGIVLVGFPLHPAGTPSTGRAEHLANVSVPMLFLQGTRDTLADLELMRETCRSLGARATLHVVDGGDHSFHVLKRTRRTDAEVLEELARATERWAGEHA
jgi:predicted alpha/beta-hydrolase family hydrolase